MEQFVFDGSTDTRARLARVTAEYDAARKAENDAAMAEAKGQWASDRQPNGTPFKSGRVEIKDGVQVFTPTGVARITSEDLRAPNMGDIMSTAMTATGRPQMLSEVTPQSIVAIQGRTMTVAIAERIGFLERGPNGQYREVGNSTGPFDRPGPSEGEQRASGPGLAQGSREGVNATTGDPAGADGGSVEAMDPDTETRIADLAESIHPTTQMKLVEKAARSFDIDTYAIGDIAAAKGCSLDEARGLVESVQAPMQTQADSAVTAEGVPDVSEMWDWAKAHRKEALQAAVRSHLMDRSTQGYRAIAQDYVSNLDTMRAADVLDAAHAAGIRARTAGGRVVLDIPGKGEMTYRAAVKAGLIRVSKA